MCVRKQQGLWGEHDSVARAGTYRNEYDTQALVFCLSMVGERVVQEIFGVTRLSTDIEKGKIYFLEFFVL